MTHLRERFRREQALSLLEFATPEHCFDTSPCEQVRFACVEDALCAMLDESLLSACGDVRAYLRDEATFLTVEAYRRMGVSGSQRDDWTDGQVEWLRDVFCEEYANEDGDDLLSDDDAVELKTRMRAVVDWYVEHATVYTCESLRKWTFDSSDLLELIEVLRPEWLQQKE